MEIFGGTEMTILIFAAVPKRSRHIVYETRRNVYS